MLKMCVADNYRLNSHHEFRAMGLANLIGSFFTCTATSGNFSRTAVSSLRSRKFYNSNKVICTGFRGHNILSPLSPLNDLHAPWRLCFTLLDEHRIKKCLDTLLDLQKTLIGPDLRYLVDWELLTYNVHIMTFGCQVTLILMDRNDISFGLFYVASANHVLFRSGLRLEARPSWLISSWHGLWLYAWELLLQLLSIFQITRWQQSLSMLVGSAGSRPSQISLEGMYIYSIDGPQVYSLHYLLTITGMWLGSWYKTAGSSDK